MGGRGAYSGWAKALVNSVTWGEYGIKKGVNLEITTNTGARQTIFRRQDGSLHLSARQGVTEISPKEAYSYVTLIKKTGGRIIKK